MRTLPLLIALATAAGCASKSGSERPDSPQSSQPESHVRLAEDCTGTVEHDTHTITCAGRYVMSRTLVESDGTWSNEELMQMTLATLRRGVETVGTTSNRRVEPNLTVDGGRGFAMQVDVQDPPQTMGMTTFARPVADGQVVGILCLDLENVDDLGRCTQMSRWFAGELPDLAWEDVSQPSAFVGKQVPVPPTCEMIRDNTLACDSGAELIWYSTPHDEVPLDTALVLAETIVEANRNRTKENPEPQVTEMSCAIDGFPGVCRVFRYPFTGRALMVVIGGGVVRDQEVAIVCDWTEDLGTDLPVPCTTFVQLLPEKAPQAL